MPFSSCPASPLTGTRLQGTSLERHGTAPLPLRGNRQQTEVTHRTGPAECPVLARRSPSLKGTPPVGPLQRGYSPKEQSPSRVWTHSTGAPV